MLVPILLCFTFINNAKTVQVQISSGLIEGLAVANEASGQSYFSFKGIPYAQAPIGELRFQAPKEPKNWTGVLDTKRESPKCYQYPSGFEDCLFLNVFTPSLPQDERTRMAVMFFIHGGAFVHGSSSWAKPEYLIANNVVLVTVNYRLNVFGFLNTGANAGNAGLKDQIAALHWVQTNIVKFNGDPNNVTIFGHSAGAASVQYLMQTKLAKGLFHRAIALSGSTLNKWSFQEQPQRKAFRLGVALGLESENATELLDFLITKTAGEVFNASLNRTVMGDHKPFEADNFVPSLELDSSEAVFTENSYTSLVENNINAVPYMIGYLRDEGFFFKRKTIDLNRYKSNLEMLVPTALNCSDGESLKLAAVEIEKYFFPNDSITDLDTFFTYLGQELFIRGITKTVELMKGQHEVYFYKFSFSESSSKVGHTDELKYIFNMDKNETEAGRKLRKQMTKLLTNFAKTGNPTPVNEQVLDNTRWPAVAKDGKTKYLHISNSLGMEENAEEKVFEFWECLFAKYGNPPYYIW